MSDYVTSLIRTGTPVVVGSVLAWLAAKAGFVVDEQTEQGFSLAFSAAVIGAYYGLTRWAETRWPAVGRLLGKRSTPTYAPPE